MSIVCRGAFANARAPRVERALCPGQLRNGVTQVVVRFSRSARATVRVRTYTRSARACARLPCENARAGFRHMANASARVFSSGNRARARN
eukprot:8592395-Lingulodinium_polyedra.AAC.1